MSHHLHMITYWNYLQCLQYRHHISFQGARTLNTHCEEGWGVWSLKELQAVLCLQPQIAEDCSERESRILWDQGNGWGTAEKSWWYSIHSLEMSFCLFSCPRANARDSEGFLENDLARKLCKCCYGHQLGGSGQGKGTTFPTYKAKPVLGITQCCYSGKLSKWNAFCLL